jgi:adenylate cyclase
MDHEGLTEEQLRRHLQRESNRALRLGAFWALLLAVAGAVSVTAASFFGLARGLSSAVIFSGVAGGYSALIWWLARREAIGGWAAWAVFLPFALLPTAFFVTLHFLLPSGAATFITGPISYLTFFLIVVTGFTFQSWLPVAAGALAAGGYFGSYLLDRAALAAISGPDPMLVQDLTGTPIYLVKCVMMIFAGLAVGALATVARRLVLRAVAEERQRAVLDRLFGEFVSEELKQLLLEDPRAQRGERKDVVILFSDIRGFTAASEQAAPEEVVSRLNAYLDEMVQAISAHGGVIDKFIGDAVMAVFGGLLPLEHPCVDAVKAAREMRRRLASLNQRWTAAGGEPLENGIGLHRGVVLQGTVGSSERKSFTVIGDAVNTASRIEGLTKEKGWRVLLSSAVQEALPPELQAECVALGRAQVKGRRAEVELFGLRDEAQPA